MATFSEYKIGLAFLLPDSLDNIIRQIEIDIMDHLGYNDGLIQPPHITIKRPFVIESLQVLANFVKQINKVALSIKNQSLILEKIGFFPGGTLYLEVSESESFTLLHYEILKICKIFTTELDPFEGNNFKPHISVAMNISGDQINTAKKIIDNIFVSSIRFSPTHLAILMLYKEQWITISKLSLR